MKWYKNILEEEYFYINDEDNSLSEIINLFYHICKIVQIDNERDSENDYGFKSHA